MNRVSNVKLLFRTINDGLNRLEEMPLSERTKTMQSLREINEQLCDYVIDLIKFVENDQRSIR